MYYVFYFACILALYTSTSCNALQGLRESYIASLGRYRNTRLHSDATGETKDISLFKERVEYIDTSVVNVEAPPNSRSLPLFLLGAPFYPEGHTFLNVFEMKYRTMMFDVANNDDVFGYVHTSPTGQIASIGTLCKVVDRQLLEDGRQYIALDGIGRFRVHKILKTLPYVTAEVDVEYTDGPVEDEKAAQQLELEVYNELKYYMRLIKTYDSSKNLLVSQATKRSRPIRGVNMDDANRRSSFSFSLANMIQMTAAREMQLLLQTKDVMKRLNVERDILKEAAGLILQQLEKLKVCTDINNSWTIQI